MVGNQETVADFLRLLKPYEIVDISRSGVIAVGRDSVDHDGAK